jgi:hypothetical protein
MRILGCVLLILFSALPAILAADEGVLNSLLAPGPLMGGHHDLENSACFKCHDVGKGVPAAKCLDCHKEIKHYVDTKRGFHGLTNKSCSECHSDHKGRDYDSVKVDEANFNHFKLTGYKLEGKHADIKCMECHKAKRTGKFVRPKDTHYFGAASSCRSCHKKDDPHFFTGKYAKQDCNVCHAMKSWKQEIHFNHDTDTRYKLEESHAKLKCNDCHLANKAKHIYKYQWTALNTAQCLSCHKEFHHDKLSTKFKGGDCLKCHDQTHWKIESFDHDVTGYHLKGKHAELKCVDCHKQKPPAKPDAPVKNFNWTGLKAACLSCHKDFHKFGKYTSKTYGNPNQCLKCHDESSWKKTHDFVHDTNTRYAIDGKHLELKCNDCHLPTGRKNPTRMPNASQGVYHWDKLETKTCENCHNNPHIGQFKPALLAKGCTSCHTTRGWNELKSENSFDHSKTRFPLTGAHTIAACKDCHEVQGKKVYKFKSFDQKFCIDCHTNVHTGQFSAKFSAQSCVQCHTTSNFTQRLPFDHSLTAYKLEGSHAKLNCTDCHKPTTARFDLRPPNVKSKAGEAERRPAMSHYLFPELASKSCTTCHADYHKGQLGTSCKDCHNVESWKKVAFDHNTQSSFHLTDKHAGVDCKKCHLPIRGEYVQYKSEKRLLIRYKPLGQTCNDCHKDPHKGEFGNSCSDCHSARGWAVTKDFHKNFTLRGVHFSLECSQCHKDGRKLAGVSQDCMLCHQKDDIHHGTLPNCRDCHMQSFWEHTSFKHSLTRFPLRGVHRTLECGECHQKGGAQAIYQGLDSRCEACHLNDAVAATSHVHSGAELTNCTQCHHNFFDFKSH